MLALVFSQKRFEITTFLQKRLNLGSLTKHIVIYTELKICIDNSMFFLQKMAYCC